MFDSSSRDFIGVLVMRLVSRVPKVRLVERARRLLQIRRGLVLELILADRVRQFLAKRIERRHLRLGRAVDIPERIGVIRQLHLHLFLRLEVILPRHVLARRLNT